MFSLGIGAALAALLPTPPLNNRYLTPSGTKFAAPAAFGEPQTRASARSAIVGVERAGPGFDGEFAFERAIAAYEELIDSTCEEARGNHVALVIPALDRMGGAERQVLLLAAGLRRRGWRVTVVVLSGTGGAAAAELAGAGVQFLSLGMRKGLADPRGWTRFIGWLWREKPDVVHAHLAHAAWLARWCRLCAPLPVLIDTLHSSSTGPIGRRMGYRLSRWLPDRVTAVSASVAVSHLSARVVNRESLIVLTNGVDVDEWRPDETVRLAMRRELGLEDEFLWFAAGRLEMVKDYPTLLKAMAIMPRRARLVIAGSGPLLNNLAHLSSHLGLGGRVKFLGFEPNVKPWLQAADGFVLSSRWEGLPMALLEAASCGVPAVATDVPGNSEVILDGYTGTLAPPMDAPALAWAMTAMMRNSAEDLCAIGARARQHAVERYSLASSFDRWEELYRELMSRKSRETSRRRVTAPNSNCASASGHRGVF
ncbi:MAG: glycosyltransferase [Terracidiphilus sp.]